MKCLISLYLLIAKFKQYKKWQHCQLCALRENVTIHTWRQKMWRCRQLRMGPKISDIHHMHKPSHVISGPNLCSNLCYILTSKEIPQFNYQTVFESFFTTIINKDSNVRQCFLIFSFAIFQEREKIRPHQIMWNFLLESFCWWDKIFQNVKSSASCVLFIPIRRVIRLHL